MKDFLEQLNDLAAPVTRAYSEPEIGMSAGNLRRHFPRWTRSKTHFKRLE